MILYAVSISAAALLCSILMYTLYRVKKQKIIPDAYCDPAFYSVYTFPNQKKLRDILSGRASEDFSYRTYAVSALSRLKDISPAQKWILSEPESADARLLYGVLLARKGFDARGTAAPDDVSDDQWDNCFAYLEKAHEELVCAYEYADRPVCEMGKFA